MRDYGYDVADYKDVDPIFGSMNDFDTLLSKAHDLGLKIILDLVFSHTSDQNIWFKESRRNKTNPKADWYVWVDAKEDGTPPNNWLAEFGGAGWTFDIRRGQYYKHNFQSSMPDLNLYNPEVREAICNVMRFWLDKGVDGFRLDVCNMYLYDKDLRDNPAKTEGITRFGSELGKSGFFYPYDMQQHIYNKCRPENIELIKMIRSVTDEYEDRMLVGETFSDDSVMRAAEYTKDETLLHTAYNFELSSPLYSAKLIRDTIERFSQISPTSWPSWALTNHDWCRVATRWGDSTYSAEQAKMLYAMLCALRGTIFVYQGEELGLENAKLKWEDVVDPLGKVLFPEYVGRDGSRTPIPWEADKENAGFSSATPWLPVYENHIPMAVDIQDKDPNSILNFVRDLIKWRKDIPEFIEGTIEFIDTAEPILAFKRGDKIYCYFNLGDQVETINIPSNLKLLKAVNCDGTPNEETLTLPAFGGAFFEGLQFT